MTGIATGSIRTEGHAVATPLQRDTIQKRALWRLGSDCDRLPTCRPPSMCVSAAAARSRLHCPPFTGRCREGRCQPEGITFLASDRHRLWPARQRRPS